MDCSCSSCGSIVKGYPKNVTFKIHFLFWTISPMSSKFEPDCSHYSTLIIFYKGLSLIFSSIFPSPVPYSSLIFRVNLDRRRMRKYYGLAPSLSNISYSCLNMGELMHNAQNSFWSISRLSMQHWKLFLSLFKLDTMTKNQSMSEKVMK